MTIEVELKALSNSSVRKLLKKLGFKLQDTEKQLNHYFDQASKIKNLELLEKVLLFDSFNSVLEALATTKYSLRTRELIKNDGTTLIYFVLKYSLSDNNHANGAIRRQIEDIVSLSLVELDTVLLKCGFNYASKWSRYRETYISLNSQYPYTVCIDKNAGYGEIVEVEAEVETESEANLIKPKLYDLLSEISLEELDSCLLDKMFAFYQDNWQNYYGTSKLIWDNPKFSF